MTTDLAGKTALVTGAGRGIGRAIALGLGRAGTRVVLLARSAAQLDETRALLLRQGVPQERIRVMPADLADEHAYRPGMVGTAMQAWIRGQDPERIGTGLHDRFTKNFTAGALITPEHSASVLLALLARDDTGAIWDVSDIPPRAQAEASRTTAC